MYRVQHQAHRMPHNIFLYEGEKLPACRTCGAAVRFQFTVDAVAPQDDQDFRQFLSATRTV